mmetsp:Transcript_64657/g.185939  ORF Transcript_64657/g.185939 Transcript_64657/m.185939 type:complete len:269 (-) Transcript_64657:968-1774(-)
MPPLCSLILPGRRELRRGAITKTRPLRITRNHPCPTACPVRALSSCAPRRTRKKQITNKSAQSSDAEGPQPGDHEEHGPTRSASANGNRRRRRRRRLAPQTSGARGQGQGSPRGSEGQRMRGECPLLSVVSLLGVEDMELRCRPVQHEDVPDAFHEAVVAALECTNAQLKQASAAGRAVPSEVAHGDGAVRVEDRHVGPVAAGPCGPVNGPTARAAGLEQLLGGGRRRPWLGREEVRRRPLRQRRSRCCGVVERADKEVRGFAPLHRA